MEAIENVQKFDVRQKEDYVEVRTLKSDEKDLLIPIEEAITQENLKEIIRITEAFDRAVEESKPSIYGAFMKNKLIGVCSCEDTFNEQKDEGAKRSKHRERVLSNVYMLPEYRKKGYAKILLKRTLYKSAPHYVWAVCSPKHLSLYQKVGFELMGNENEECLLIKPPKYL